MIQRHSWFLTPDPSKGQYSHIWLCIKDMEGHFLFFFSNFLQTGKIETLNEFTIVKYYLAIYYYPAFHMKFWDKCSWNVSAYWTWPLELFNDSVVVCPETLNSYRPLVNWEFVEEGETYNSSIYLSHLKPLSENSCLLMIELNSRAKEVSQTWAPESGIRFYLRVDFAIEKPHEPFNSGNVVNSLVLFFCFLPFKNVPCLLLWFW